MIISSIKDTEETDMATARDRYNNKAYSEPLDKGRAAAEAADMAEAEEELQRAENADAWESMWYASVVDQCIDPLPGETFEEWEYRTGQR